MGTILRQGNKTFVVEAVFYYQVQCPVCGGLSIAGLSPEDAVEIATESGWRETLDGNIICPICDYGGEYVDGGAKGSLAELGQE